MTATLTPAELVRSLVKLRWSPLVLSAGMRRSGSTLLFNILRELLATEHRDGLVSGWVGDLESLPRGTIYLIKTHDLGALRHRAKAIFYTFRDIRTALVSDARRFQEPLTLEQVDQRIAQYTLARRHATLCLKYEELIASPLASVSAIAAALNVTADPEAIWNRASTLKSPTATDAYSKTTLLHPEHKTGTSDDDWREFLDPALADRIHARYRWWFRECGYPEG